MSRERYGEYEYWCYGVKGSFPTPIFILRNFNQQNTSDLLWLHFIRLLGQDQLQVFF